MGYRWRAFRADCGSAQTLKFALDHERVRRVCAQFARASAGRRNSRSSNGVKCDNVLRSGNGTTPGQAPGVIRRRSSEAFGAAAGAPFRARNGALGVRPPLIKGPGHRSPRGQGRSGRRKSSGASHSRRSDLSTAEWPRTRATSPMRRLSTACRARLRRPRVQGVVAHAASERAGSMAALGCRAPTRRRASPATAVCYTRYCQSKPMARRARGSCGSQRTVFTRVAERFGDCRDSPMLFFDARDLPPVRIANFRDADTAASAVDAVRKQSTGDCRKRARRRRSHSGYRDGDWLR